MQVPILAGMTAIDGSFSASYPINLEPRAFESGLSKGQLVSTRGAVTVGTGPGKDRGGTVWNGTHYRVMGSMFCRVAVDGTVTELGDVGNDNRACGFDYGFDRLAIRSAGKLFYFIGAAPVAVTDPDLGEVRDMLWSDGYYVTTDGSYIVVTNLTDPTAVDPIKYGSAEEDPDMIVCLMKYQEEVLAVGRYTIQSFQNTGGLTFPFTVVQGAMIPYGAVGVDAKCMIAGAFAFVGSGRDEPIRLYVASGGTAKAISTREVDALLNAHPSPELIELEARVFGDEQILLVHLEDCTVGISLNTSAIAQDGAWFILHSGNFAPYRLRHAVWCYGKHFVGDTDSAALGVLSTTDDRHFGDRPEWQFDAALMFNDGMAYIVNEVELFGQFPTVDQAVFFSMSRDGVLWSREVARRLSGDRAERVRWPVGARVPTMAAMRWRGQGRVAISRAEMQAEPLS